MLSPAVQLARNKQLDSFFVRNLNQDPTGWALEDKSVDAALCCVSVQYLQQVTMLHCMQCTSEQSCCSSQSAGDSQAGHSIMAAGAGLIITCMRPSCCILC